jgi:hypothetical protein
MANMLSVHRKAWSIEDVVKDVYESSINDEGEEVMMLASSAEVHIGPYADVRFFQLCGSFTSADRHVCTSK